MAETGRAVDAASTDGTKRVSGIDRGPLRTHGRRVFTSSFTVAAVALLVYGGWIVSAFRSGHEIRDFIFIGRSFVEQSHASSVIRLDRHYHYLPDRFGYDGQFGYYIALDPIHARYYLDDTGPGAAGPDYRYTRILYPMLARLVALGRSDLIPYMLLLINWLALGGGTLAVAAWLKRKALSPWFALIYGLYPGLLVALERDLTEALAYALIAVGVYLFDFGGPARVLGAGIAFALATLTRETAAVFPVIYGLALLVGSVGGMPQDEGGPQEDGEGAAGAGPYAERTARVRNSRRQWRQGWLLLGVSLLPIVLYKAFLFVWLGTIGRTGGLYPQLIPFGGILSYWPWHDDQVEEVLGIILPSLICAGMGIWALWKRLGSLPPQGGWSVEVWALLLNILLFVVLLNVKSYGEYFASGRITIGVVLAALYCLPFLVRLTVRNRWWLWSCAIYWFYLWPALFPFYRRRPVVSDVLIDVGMVAGIWLLTRVGGPAEGGRKVGLTGGVEA